MTFIASWFKETRLLQAVNATDNKFHSKLIPLNLDFAHEPIVFWLWNVSKEDKKYRTFQF